MSRRARPGPSLRGLTRGPSDPIIQVVTHPSPEADMPLTASLGISDFRLLRAHGGAYVDKTRFIIEVLRCPAPALLILRPPGFGRTLALSTLRAFAGRGEGRQAALFDGLEVWSAPDMLPHAGRYPVIELSLKDTGCPDRDLCIARVGGAIAEAFKAHSAVIDSLEPADAGLFQAIAHRRADRALLEESLTLLTRFVHQHTGEPALVLIDDHDVPLRAAFLGGFGDEILAFFHNLLGGAFKDNPHLLKGVVTGAMHIAQGELFAGVEGVDLRSGLRAGFSDAFGFTAGEIADLIAMSRLDVTVDRVTAWCGGYRFGAASVARPGQVLRRLVDVGARPTETAVGPLVRFALGQDSPIDVDDRAALMQGVPIESRLVDDLTLADLDDSPDAALSLLYFAGLLTAEVRIEGGEVRAALRIPNRASQALFTSTYRRCLEKALGGQSRADGFIQALLTGDSSRMQAALRQTLAIELSGSSPPERVRTLPWSIFLLALVADLTPRYGVRGRELPGEGRAEVLITPVDRGQAGVVLTLEVLDAAREPAPEAGLMRALTRIDADGLPEIVMATGAKAVHRVAVLFHGETVHARSG